MSEFLLTALLTCAAAGVALFMFCGIVVGKFMGAPYVRSRKEKVARMIAVAGIVGQERVMDLGSGDGSLVIAAARAGGDAIGIEMNPFLVWYSRLRIRLAGLENQARIVCGNFYDADLGRTDVLLLYLLPATLASLRMKMEQELKPGSRIISNAFPISGWEAAHANDGIFLYRKS